VAPVWTYHKGTAYVSSPILVGGPPEPSRFMASMVAVGDRILQTSEDGDVFVIRAGPKHEVLATNPIGEPVQTSPAIANGRIYIRGEKHLFAIGG
jgi:hypothetical protein